MALQLPPWVAAHKPQAAAGALVAVAGTIAYVKKRKAAASPSTATTPSTAFGTAGSAVDAGTFDSSGYDVYNSLEAQYEALQTKVDQLSTTPPVATQIPVTVPTDTLNTTTGTLPVNGGGSITVVGGTPTAVTNPGGTTYQVPTGTVGLAGVGVVAAGGWPPQKPAPTVTVGPGNKPHWG